MASNRESSCHGESEMSLLLSADHWQRIDEQQTAAPIWRDFILSVCLLCPLINDLLEFLTR